MCFGKECDQQEARGTHYSLVSDAGDQVCDVMQLVLVTTAGIRPTQETGQWRVETSQQQGTAGQRKLSSCIITHFGTNVHPVHV